MRGFKKSTVIILLTALAFSFAYRKWAQKDAYVIPVSATLEEWRYLLRPSEDCPLPCWWAIVPGKTTQAEAQTRAQLILPGYDIVERQLRDGTEFISADPKDIQGPPHTITNPFNFFVQFDEDNIVELIELSIGGIFVDVFEARDAWIYFTPTNLIEIYGIPTEIETDLFFADGRLYGSNLEMYWEDSGLAVTLALPLAPSPYSVGDEGCFILPHVGYFRVLLQAPYQDRSLLTGRHDIAATKPIEEISPLTIPEFVELLVENDGCIPHDIPVREFP